ncbi:MAG TPA: metallopeptidase TldD-related protein [Polyangiaceae bacterium]|nr:metallopeptidase TldD-related protein [Polyangiaceae bacterium]
MSDPTIDPTPRLLELAADLVERARKLGADVAEASARTGWELSAKVRLGKTELVEEAGHHGVSLRVIRGGRVATTATSDLTPAGIERCVADALELCALSEPDPFAGPAAAELLCKPPHPDLQLFDPSIDAIDAERAIAQARLAEQAALDSDKRITNSEGATYSRTSGASALVLSSGFQGAVRGSYAALSVAPVVEDEGGKKRRGHYYSASRQHQDLESAEYIGQEAARRTLRKLGARKIPTTEAPVVFDPDMARSLVGSLAGCVVGGALWRKSSYLLDREGTAVASSLVNIVDDPLILRGPGSRPFDGEGLRSRKNVIVEAGTLKGFLLDSYSARKLGRESTASAGRSGGSIGASTSNFILAAGSTKAADIVKSTTRGLYVTELMGFGFNAVTGDFSRGAAGFWIENGEFAFPVSEITISSTLDAMLKSVDAVGDDLELKSSTASPTLRVSSMTISGT